MHHHTHRRIVTVVLAPVAALCAWALVRMDGIDLTVSGGGGRTVGAPSVVVAASLAALAGWLVVRVLERHAGQPRRLWGLLAGTALGASMVGPSWLADGSSAVALMGLHVVTAVVVICGFAPTLPVWCEAGDRGRVTFRPSGDPAR